MRPLIVLSLVLAACVPTGTGAPSPTANATASAAASSPAQHAYRGVTVLGDFAQLSPDGQTLISYVQGPKGTTPYYVFQRLDGVVVGRIDNVTAMSRPEWLADSSGVFIELAAGQRAGPLGVLQTDGKLIDSGLDDANPLLSPDGKWIAAERQEGCCVDIRIHEIRVAPRAGGSVRTVVTSSDPAPQPISFLGWSASGDVVYRDGARIRSVTLDGHVSEMATAATIRGRTLTRSAISPDGLVILACAADPLAFGVVTGAAMTDLPWSPAWPIRAPWCSRADEVIWVGGHGLAVRDGAGQSMVFDGIGGTSRALALPADSTLIAGSADALLVSIGGDLHVLSGAGDRAVGLRAADYTVRPIDGGRFFLLNGRSGYLIG